ncbi:MAG: DUF2723 domain-containing protein [Chloroflexota bacterium]
MTKVSRFWAEDQAAALLVGTISLFFYLITMPSGLTWAHYGVDGAELITASFTLGVGHPPGYPVYVVLGKLFSYLPVGSIAYRYNLFSAVSMSVAAIFVSQIVYAKQKNSHFFWSVIAGLTFALGELIWQQAIITEVYALFMAFFAMTVWALLTGKGAGWVGFLFGLTFVSHTTAVFLLPLILWQTSRQKWPQLLKGVLFGLIPVLWLPLLALGEKPIAWENPTQLMGWWRLVTAQIYQGNAFNFTHIPIQARLIHWGAIWSNQFTIAGIPLAGYALYKNRHSKEKWSLYWAFVGTAVLYLLFAFFYSTDDAIVFSLPAFLFIALLLIDGVKELGRWATILPLTLILLHFTSVNINQDRFVHQQVNNLLEQVPQNALLETSGEAILFPLWYAKFVEHRRKDILLFDNQLFTYSWYRNSLSIQDETLTLLGEDISQFRMQQSMKRPYCNIVSHPEKERTVQVNCQPQTHDE